MTEHPDGKFKYVVECFDRCSRLTWLFPAERAVANDIAEALVKTVFCVTGLPCYVITNCGYDFLEKMLGEIERRWYGKCNNFILYEKSKRVVRVLSFFYGMGLFYGLYLLWSLFILFYYGLYGAIILFYIRKVQLKKKKRFNFGIDAGNWVAIECLSIEPLFLWHGTQVFFFLWILCFVPSNFVIFLISDFYARLSIILAHLSLFSFKLRLILVVCLLLSQRQLHYFLRLSKLIGKNKNLQVKINYF